MEIIISLLSIVLIIYAILKNINPPAMLMIAGLVLLSTASIMGKDFGLEVSSGSGFFDVFFVLKDVFYKRTTGLGVIIMMVSGFGTYLSSIGASHRLVDIMLKPLSVIKNQYILIVACYLVLTIINMFITSATGLGLLLMVTIYPVLLKLGLSRGSIVAICVTASAFELGPTQTNLIVGAEVSKMDIMTYFTNYQVTASFVAAFFTAIAHGIWQKICDKKLVEENLEVSVKEEKSKAPVYYALIPIVPLILMIVFSKIFISSIKMHIVVALLVAVFLGILFEILNKKPLKEVLGGMSFFLEGMGKVYGSVIGLIIGAEFFTTGLKSLGVIDKILSFATDLGFGAVLMVLVACVLIVLTAILTGSGNAAFLSLSSIGPKVASKLGIDIGLVVFPMSMVAGLGRSVSPIAAVVIATAGIAKVSPVDIIKRTSVPMLVGFIVGMTIHLTYHF